MSSSRPGGHGPGRISAFDACAGEKPDLPGRVCSSPLDRVEMGELIAPA